MTNNNTAIFAFELARISKRYEKTAEKVGIYLTIATDALKTDDLQRAYLAVAASMTALPPARKGKDPYVEEVAEMLSHFEDFLLEEKKPAPIAYHEPEFHTE